MHKNIINKHFSKSDKIEVFHMIVDDDPAVVDSGSVFRWYVLLSVNEQPVADKHHMTSLLFCLPHYRIKVFSSVVNFSGILFADAERGSF
jgi:hypothetical protein